MYTCKECGLESNQRLPTMLTDKIGICRFCADRERYEDESEEEFENKNKFINKQEPFQL